MYYCNIKENPFVPSFNNQYLLGFYNYQYPQLEYIIITVYLCLLIFYIEIVKRQQKMKELSISKIIKKDFSYMTLFVVIIVK